MPPVKNVGKPCAGEPHARFDGRELETEQTSRHGYGEERHYGKPCGHRGSVSYRRSTPPRQFPTLPTTCSVGPPANRLRTLSTRCRCSATIPASPATTPSFASAYCSQAWQWNLDYVVDPHGNTESFWYTQETNKYARD